jgi:hypothetical protein
MPRLSTPAAELATRLDDDPWSLPLAERPAARELRGCSEIDGTAPSACFCGRQASIRAGRQHAAGPREPVTSKESQALRQREQDRWLPRPRSPVEPPPLDDNSPAFLIATTTFARSRAALEAVASVAAMPTVISDGVQRFVDAYRHHLDDPGVGAGFPR